MFSSFYHILPNGTIFDSVKASVIHVGIGTLGKFFISPPGAPKTDLQAHGQTGNIGKTFLVRWQSWSICSMSCIRTPASELVDQWFSAFSDGAITKWCTNVCVNISSGDVRLSVGFSI